MKAIEARLISVKNGSEDKLNSSISKIEALILKACNKGKFEALIPDYYITSHIDVQGHFTSIGYVFSKNIDDCNFIKISW